MTLFLGITSLLSRTYDSLWIAPASLVIPESVWILRRQWLCQSVGLSNKNKLFVISQFTENDEIFLNDQFRVYFKSAVEQISLEFAEFKLNGNNH